MVERGTFERKMFIFAKNNAALQRKKITGASFVVRCVNRFYWKVHTACTAALSCLLHWDTWHLIRLRVDHCFKMASAVFPFPRTAESRRSPGDRLNTSMERKLAAARVPLSRPSLPVRVGEENGLMSDRCYACMWLWPIAVPLTKSVTLTEYFKC